MPIEWNAEGDFAAVVDTLEPVTLYRCPHGGAGVEMLAWRFDDATDSPDDAESAVRRRVVVWQLPLEVEGALAATGRRGRRRRRRVLDDSEREPDAWRDSVVVRVGARDDRAGVRRALRLGAADLPRDLGRADGGRLADVAAGAGGMLREG